MRFSRLAFLVAVYPLAFSCAAAATGTRPPGPPPEQVRTRLDQACQSGRAQACLDLGRALEQARWNAGDRAAEQASRAFARACELGSCQACLAAGDTDQAAHACVAPCEAGRRRACFGLMTVERYGDEAAGRPERAAGWARRYLELTRAACDAGDPGACHDLGVALAIGFPDIPIDPDASATAFAQAAPILAERCRGGHAGSCALLIAQHDFKTGTLARAPAGTASAAASSPPAGLAFACRVLRTDCAAGNWSSCGFVDRPPCQE